MERNKELKVSFDKKTEEEAARLSQRCGMTIHQYLRHLVKQGLSEERKKSRFKALRFVESASIVMQYLESGYDLSTIAFDEDMTESNVRLKVVKAVKEVMQYHSEDSEVIQGLMDIKNMHDSILEKSQNVLLDAGMTL